MRVFRNAALISIIGVGVAAYAQAPRRSASATPPTASASDPVTTASLENLPFRNIGPASSSGRIDDFAVLESNPVVFYVASAMGGVWKTVNNGATFDQVFGSETTASIGDIAIAPNDANLLWVGTGENNNRQSSSWGDGVYKSTDGGRTWAHMGLRDSRAIARIIVDPVDHDVVYVAALGSLWGAGGERGLYKTVDGGLTWTRVLDAGPDAGATELVMDPTNNKVLYAATYQRRRTPWGMNGGGPASGIWKSGDAGRTWTRLTKGIPEGPLGRIGLDVYRKDPNVLYARIEHATESGVYRSADAGASWTKLSTQNPRPMYFSQIRIDPSTDSRIYALGTQLLFSDDGGKTFSTEGAKQIHVDFHAMWIDPNNPSHILVGNDGGASVSFDRSKTYIWFNNLPVGQYYHVSYDMQSPYWVCAGAQDDDTWCGPTAVRNEWGIANDDWIIVSGGDGFQAAMDPTNPRIVYAESQGGRVSRVDRLTNERTLIQPEPAAGEKPYRWNWDTPVILSPHDPATIFLGANRVFKSTDRGTSWKVISPDLSLNLDRDTLPILGVLGKDIKIAKHDGVSAYGTLSTFAESRLRRGLYWAGTDDGQLQVSRDDGATWTNVSAKVTGVPKGTYVSRVAPSRFNEGTVYVTYDGHRGNDYGTYVVASSDYGTTWTSIAGDLPKGQVVRTITEDLKNADVLYLGTESGLFFTYDRGKHWVRLKGTFPTVQVPEITLHERDNAMIIATHGRALWVLDDLTPLQQYGKALASSGAYVFPATAAVQRNASQERQRDFEGDMKFLGKNPPRGAQIAFYTKTAPKSVKLTVKDAGGALVREVMPDSAAPKPTDGINTLVWDLRVQPLKVQRGVPLGGGFFGTGLEGPLVLPGTYTAAVVVDGKEIGSTQIAVRGDPEIVIADADRKTAFEAAKELHAMHATADLAAAALVEAYDQLAPARAAMRDSTKVPAAVRASWRNFSMQLDSLRTRFGVAGGGFGGGGFGAPNVRNKVSQLKQSVLAATALPTQQQMRQLGEVREELPKAVAEVNALLAKLPALWAELAQAGIYPVVPKPVGN